MIVKSTERCEYPKLKLLRECNLMQSKTFINGILCTI